jgi:hypothetical protein
VARRPPRLAPVSAAEAGRQHHTSTSAG